MRSLVAYAAVAAAMLSSVSTSYAATSLNCWRASEVESARVRHLQSMLMVAAFKCNAQYYDSRGIYNDFVRTHRSTLVEHNTVLKRYFMREHGPIEGQRAYDRFTTTLANVDSDDSNAMPDDFCEAADMIGREAVETPASALIVLAGDLHSEPAGTRNRCEVGPAVIAAAAVIAPAEPVAIPAVAVIPVADIAPAAPDLPPVEVAAALPEPAAAPLPVPVAVKAEAPAVLRPVAVTDIAQPDNQADTARALAAAAVALQAAAEALKAASNPIADAAPVARTAVPGALN